MEPRPRKSPISRFAARAALIISAAVLPSTHGHAGPDPRPNVLFIMVDDLGPWLGAYGRDYVHSPHIDALARGGMQFNRAYAQVPVCGASRSSMFTGIKPTQTRFTRARSSVENDAPGAVTLPQLMRDSGYHTYSVGKVFDDSSDTAERSWSEPPVVPGADMYEWGERGFAVLHTLDPDSRNYVSERDRGPIYEHPDVPDDAYFDGQVAQLAIEKLREMKEGDAPFLLAAGFFNPHLPFYAPKRYWDLYNRDEIPLAEVRTRPHNAPRQLTGSNEFRAYHLRGMDVDSDEFHRVMRHGYFACVSYVDKLVGDLLAELERLELDGNTIVVLWGDHGFNLGEHGFWGKHNLMGGSTHIPLLIRAPGVTRPGATSNALVESTDLFPTLAALAGIEPGAELAAQWDGTDLTPLLDGSVDDIPRDAAYTRWQHGDNLVTRRLSYTEYGRYRRGTRQEVVAAMLFDLKKDPGENTNVVEEEKYVPLIAPLSERLREILK